MRRQKFFNLLNKNFAHFTKSKNADILAYFKSKCFGYREVIKRGVRKVNYYTYMAKAGGEAVSDKKYSQLHDALLDAERAMKENVKSAMKIFLCDL